ncbi:hypothetical protein GCM10009122_23230 [Fulvivirga kasyanovii]|uniref:N-acetylmuramoyl-L-alanine amidase n=1 Tax=Fulvivirga kasyanovii TaxID=396812 RepID=A0ABW9RYG5_9BACT|nr:N-acetylmuramoyl-L-alanine amidase [Fulvivirga kasyanovii]MTI28971.1 N-acetylmuramoyl-L-alanine amidase [Fulvivirga kasyanovii]
MKKPDYLILMSTETMAAQAYTKAELIGLHTSSLAHGGKGWNRPGIDDLVLQDGSLQAIIPEGLPNEVDLWGISEGVNGLNGLARYLAYSGGRSEDMETNEDTRTEAQRETLETIVKYYVKRHPHLLVMGFDEVPNKKDALNPGFEVAEWLEEIGIPDKNIYKKTSGKL